MRCGIVILPQEPWARARRTWVDAETLGFDHVWTYDHLSWRSLADEPWGATIPTLVAAATVTSTIRIGTFVSSPNFRHPVTFAKDVATLDDIAGGRVVLGIGSGGTGFDAFVLGQPELTPRQRHARFVEFVDGLDELLRFEVPGSGGITRRGEWFEAVNARMVGLPAQQPRVPFVIAANGPKGLGVVVRHAQGWATTGPDGLVGNDWWSGVATLARRLEVTADAAGRDPATIDRLLLIDAGGQYALESVGAFEELVGRATELGFTDVITHWPRAEGIYSGTESVLQEVASRLPSLR